MENIEFGIKLLKTKIEQINFKEPSEDFIKDFDEKKLKIDMTLSFSCKIELEKLSVGLNIEYNYEAEEKHSLLNYNAIFDFQIINLENVVKKVDDKIDIPTHILNVVTGVAIGTTRGIIIGKTAGAFVNQFYIPIVNPEEIVNNIKTTEIT